MGVQGFLILIGSSIHTLGWGGRYRGLQAGSWKGKYNQQLKIDWHFLFFANATHCKPLYLFLHLARIPVLNLSLYGLSKQSSFFFFIFFPLAILPEIFLLHISQRKLSFNLSTTTKIYPPIYLLFLSAPTIVVQTTIFSYLDQHSSLLTGPVTLTFVSLSQPPDSSQNDLAEV